MNKNIKLYSICLFSVVSAFTFSCKQKQMTVNPGAVVSKDGTDDGLNNVKGEFKNASRTDEGIKFTLSSDVLFDTNSSYLKQPAKTELDKLIKILNQDRSKKIRVDGHTDSTGEEKYNQWLSEKRAASVEKYLQEGGISSSRITTEGYGQSAPVADNKSAEGRRKNRRVDIIILD